jgi:putative tricarboxylic transport membrane protein
MNMIGSLMGSEYIGVFVHADSLLKTGKDLVAVLRKKPDALSASIGLGPATTLHVSYMRAMKAAGVDIKKLRTVGFNSGSQATTALLGGHIDAAVATASVMLTHIRSARLRMIAIGAPARQTGELSQVSTWRELGVQGTYELWRGIAGPKGMSQQQLHYWDDVLAKVVKSEPSQHDIESSYMINSYEDSKVTTAYWKQEYEDAKAVLTELGFVK